MRRTTASPRTTTPRVASRHAAPPLRARAAGAAASALLIALAGCPRVPPPDLSRDPSALLDQVRAAQARVQRVKGNARVKVDAPNVSGTVPEFIAAEKPDRVHLETLDFFGNPAAVLVAADGRFAFLDVRANVFYRGDATPDNVSRLLPVVIPVEELVTILCGSAPLLPGKPLDATVEGGTLLLTIGAGDVGQRIAVGELASVEWSRVRKAGPSSASVSDLAPAYDLEFESFQRRGSVRFPGEVRLDAPAGKARVRLAWRDDLEIDGRLDPALFRLEPPKGARVVDLARGAPVPAYDLPAR
jgi:hypothetical protein